MALSEAIDRLTEEDFKEMDQANTALDKALGKENPVKASMADIRFHDVFIKRSENPHLIAIIRDLKIKYRRVEVTYFEGYASAKYSLDEHHRIVAALRSGDLAEAQLMIRENWQSSLKRLKKIESRVI